MKKILIALLVVGTTLQGCQNYLDVVPKGKFIPETIQDFEELSSNPSYNTSENALLERLSDGIYLSDALVKSGINSSNTKTYIWAPEHYLITDSDRAWESMYNNIYNANLILESLDGIKDGTIEQKNILRGNALFNRAFAYSNLVFSYAPYYDVKTASQDMAVPLVLKTDLEAKNSRNTVKEVYDQILLDLHTAIPLLPVQAKNVYRNNKATAQAVLARVYLNMANYELALKYAKESLLFNSTLFDYNTLRFINPDRPAMGVANKPVPVSDPEMIGYRITNFGTALTSTSISPDLMATLSPGDLRFVFGWSTTDRTGKPNKDLYPLYINSDLNYNISVPEMMLIVAECEARSDNKDGALDKLNSLRKKRIKQDVYVDLSASNATEALKLVIKERRMELFGKGLRWFDMKRLDKDPLFSQTYKRANTEKEYVLEKGSLNFVNQIPAKVRNLNSVITPNPR